jgi:hypothetical protein
MTCARCPQPLDRVGKLCRACCAKSRDRMRRSRGYPKPRLGRRPDPQYRHEVTCRLTSTDYAQLVLIAGPDPLGRVVRDAVEAYLRECGR